MWKWKKTVTLLKFKRRVKEAIAIHKNQPGLNRDRGYEIPPILLKLVSCDHSDEIVIGPWSCWNIWCFNLWFRENKFNLYKKKCRFFYICSTYKMLCHTWVCCCLCLCIKTKCLGILVRIHLAIDGNNYKKLYGQTEIYGNLDKNLLVEASLFRQFGKDALKSRHL